MAKWIIEEDVKVVETSYYAVEADTLEEAIEKAKTAEPYHTTSFPSDVVGYDDSHEATDAEWAAVTVRS
jgi:hypothetical protein